MYRNQNSLRWRTWFYFCSPTLSNRETFFPPLSNRSTKIDGLLFHWAKCRQPAVNAHHKRIFARTGHQLTDLISHLKILALGSSVNSTLRWSLPTGQEIALLSPPHLGLSMVGISRISQPRHIERIDIWYSIGKRFTEVSSANKSSLRKARKPLMVSVI